MMRMLCQAAAKYHKNKKSPFQGENGTNFVLTTNNRGCLNEAAPEAYAK